MTMGIARVTDITICRCTAHRNPVTTIGIITQGSHDSFANSLSIARQGDIAICTCGHITIIASSSAVTLTNNRGTARITDVTVGSPVGNIVSGSSDSLTT